MGGMKTFHLVELPESLEEKGRGVRGHPNLSLHAVQGHASRQSKAVLYILLFTSEPCSVP